MTRWLVCAVAALGCSQVELEPAPEVIHARFDPDAKVIPMPTDILRDEVLGRLDLPVDDEDLTAAERDFYRFLNTMDGWSTAMSATIELTGPVAPSTVDGETLQVWHWRETPQRVEGVRVSLDATETEITIDPPREGWARGGRYVIVLRGGDRGVEGKRGEPVVADAAFYFLRLTEALDTAAHERAFPGADRAERQQNAADLEEIRAGLVPYFDFFEERGIARGEVAALWSFTVTERTELAMDKASQRMPLPIDLLIDPETGRIDIPPAAWDTETVARAKERLRTYDGFGTSSKLLFGFTGPIDPASVTPASVQLYRVDDEPAAVDIELTVLDDLHHVEIEPLGAPLAENARYAVVVRDAVRDADGRPVVTMPVGHFLKSNASVLEGGESAIAAVETEDARKLEPVRADVDRALRALGRDGVLAAWTFTTMSVTAPMEEIVTAPERSSVAVDPANIEHQTPLQALADFVLGVSSLFWVGDVYHGTIESPVYLDPLTRAWRGDGDYEIQDIPFTMTVPRFLPDDGSPVPVVIFGHAVMSERRFVLAIGDKLAEKGFVAISIDFPFHGERTYCWSEGPLAVPNPETGEITTIEDPCQDGYTCAEDGRCVDAAGKGNALRPWPVLGMPQASGAAFIEIEHIANTRDHFRQAVLDLRSLLRSLRQGDWEPVIGAPVDVDRIMYAGQSLGGIIGSTFVSVSPEISRAVLNVPGADTVDLFSDSPFFSGHVDAFFTREGVAPESYEGHRFLNVARWFMDSTDPASFAHRLMEDREVMIQMATLDFIIPNDYTLKLETLSGAPRRDYIGEHAFLVIPVEPAYARGTRELARFLAGEWKP